MTFFIVITLFYMVIYCHQLPFYLICRGAPHQIQPHFCLIPTKMPRKFFVALGGAPAPLHHPGYAYVNSCKQSTAGCQSELYAYAC